MTKDLFINIFNVYIEPITRLAVMYFVLCLGYYVGHKEILPTVKNNFLKFNNK